MTSLSPSPIDYISTIISVKSISLSRIGYEFTIYTRFHHRFPELLPDFFMNSRSVSRNDYKCTISQIYYDFTHCFRKFTLNELFFPAKYYEFTICFVNLLWIHYLFRVNTIDPLSLLLKNYELTFCYESPI